MTHCTRTTRRMVALAVVTLGALTACGTSQQPAPSTTTTTSTTAPTVSPSPTQKDINPTGGNLFTPPVQAPTAATVAPGQHPGINGVN